MVKVPLVSEVSLNIDVPILTVQRRQWHPTPVLLPGKSHGQRSLVVCSPWGNEESETTKRLHSHFSLSPIGEGSGNPLQCSCLENPGDGEAWWAAVCGVAQSRTRLKWLSSSSSSILLYVGFPCGSTVKKLPAVHELQGMWVQSLGREDAREWPPTPVFLPGESRGQRSLVGYSPWDPKESDMTETV